MYDIISKRFISFGISGFLLLISVSMFLFLPLNYGIDITGGTQTEYSYEDDIEIDSLKSSIDEIVGTINQNGEVINNLNLYGVTGENTFVVEAGFVRTIEEKELESLKIQFRDEVTDFLQSSNSTISFSRYINIGASFGDYIKDTAKITLLLAVIGIAIYVAYAFSQSVGGINSSSFAIITIITLFHDVMIATGFYIISSAIFPEFKIDTFFVTALLTILGYSINDTIIVFDRIRTNLKLYGGKKKKDLKEIVNLSVNETLSRSIYTSLTVLFVLVSILFFGPESISGFTLAMIFGTVVGTYSSIFIASPLLYEINKNKRLQVYKKKEHNQDDLIVV